MEPNDLNPTSVADALCFEDASALLDGFNELTHTLTMAEALEIMRSPMWLPLSTTSFVYVKLQVAACLADFFIAADNPTLIIVDRQTYALVEPTRAEALSFVLAAIFPHKTAADRRRLDEYTKALASLLDGGFYWYDIVRELYLRGGPKRILAEIKAASNVANLDAVPSHGGWNG